MRCFKCGKEMDREDDGPSIKGIDVTISQDLAPTQETIDYNNTQLGKYSDGEGGCHVAICYECYIDGLFHLTWRNNWLPHTTRWSIER